MKAITLCAVAIMAGSQVVTAGSSTPPSSCTSGQGKKDYDTGRRFADSTFTTSWNFLKQDCAKLEQLVDIMYTSAPYRPYCKQLGYQDATFDNYAKAQDKCFKDCQGNGRIMGETLGSQFCAITGLAAARGMPQPPTVAICNSIEQSECEKRYASYVNKQCAGAKSSQADYYNSLKKSCKAL